MPEKLSSSSFRPSFDLFPFNHAAHCPAGMASCFAVSNARASGLKKSTFWYKAPPCGSIAFATSSSTALVSLSGTFSLKSRLAVNIAPVDGTRIQ